METSPVSIPSAAVRVRYGRKDIPDGLGMIAVLPATIRLARVSPMALPIPRMIAAAIPEGGRYNNPVYRLPPGCTDARNLRGIHARVTELIASSETLTIVGGP